MVNSSRVGRSSEFLVGTLDKWKEEKKKKKRKGKEGKIREEKMTWREKEGGEKYGNN